MQTDLNHSAVRPVSRRGSGRDYMMRSEKRSANAYRSSSSSGKPPRKRRKRAGFFYKLLMTLLLLTLWPVGLMLLWRRKVRWSAITKLLTSIVTLAACVILIGFALTVNTDNPRYTAMQDSVNSFLDSAADTLVNSGAIVSEHAAEMLDDMENVADALWSKGRIYLADGIETGVHLTQDAYENVVSLVETLRSTPEPDPASTQQPTETEDGASLPQSAATASASVEPTAPEDAAVESENNASDPVATQASEAPSASADAAVQTSTAPAAETVAQVITPSATLKPAAQATVYHSIDGKWYHTFNRCSGMTGGGAYTLEECADTHKRCRACGAPDAALIGQTCLWMDANKLCHTSDECDVFEGKYTLILRDDALEQALTGCSKCGGSEYLIPNSTLNLETPAPSDAEN